MIKKTHYQKKINALCIDVDDLYSSLLEAGYIKEKNLSSNLKRYVDSEMLNTLDYLDNLKIKATFFIPGHFLNNYPHIVKEIYSRGNHIASHGITHNFLEKIGIQRFKSELKESKLRLEDLTGQLVNTFKAPIWGISTNSLWAYDCLIDAGFTVDNTAKPEVKYALNQKKFDNSPFSYQNEITIIPPTTIKILWKEMLFCGGFYNAYIPYFIQKKYFKKINSLGLSFNYYCHPFEISPALNKLQRLSLVPQVGIYSFLYSLHSGIYATLIKKLFNDFSLTTLKNAYSEYY